ncbi:MAG: SDR family NAD(P)-dependent oxidoreductase, partial [Steroidobacteraceae bacterium]
MKSILVTGGANGIGAAICRAAAEEGYRVGVVDLSPEACQTLVSSLPGAGHQALAADVTREDQITAVFDAFGDCPDVVVNNAGIVRFGSLLEQTVDDWRTVVGINLTGSYIVAREAGLRMRPRGSGCIINMSSINAITPGPGSGAYPSTKAGVVAMTELLALELGGDGIRVNAVAPGFVDGGMSAPIYADPEVRALRGGAVPLKRLASEQDIANAVLWLASDKAGYVTGHHLVVDGGVSHSVL